MQCFVLNKRKHDWEGFWRTNLNITRIFFIFFLFLFFLVRDVVQYSRIFAIHSRINPFYSRNVTFITQDITNTLLKRFECPYTRGKNPENISNRKLSRPEIEPGPARWNTTTLPLDHSGDLLQGANVWLEIYNKVRTRERIFNTSTCDSSRVKKMNIEEVGFPWVYIQ